MSSDEASQFSLPEPASVIGQWPKDNRGKALHHERHIQSRSTLADLVSINHTRVLIAGSPSFTL
jgi:hypothetical protein